MRYVLLLIPMLCSCSSSMLTNLVKPDTGITAQVGKTNTKQLAGLSTTKEQRTVSGNAKVDNTTIAKGNSIKDVSTVTIPTGSIPISSITANKVVVNNNSVITILLSILLAILITILLLKHSKRSQ